MSRTVKSLSAEADNFGIRLPNVQFVIVLMATTFLWSLFSLLDDSEIRVSVSLLNAVDARDKKIPTGVATGRVWPAPNERKVCRPHIILIFCREFSGPAPKQVFAEQTCRRNFKPDPKQNKI